MAAAAKGGEGHGRERERPHRRRSGNNAKEAGGRGGGKLRGRDGAQIVSRIEINEHKIWEETSVTLL